MGENTQLAIITPFGGIVAPETESSSYLGGAQAWGWKALQYGPIEEIFHTKQTKSKELERADPAESPETEARQPDDASKKSQIPSSSGHGTSKSQDSQKQGIQRGIGPVSPLVPQGSAGGDPLCPLPSQSGETSALLDCPWDSEEEEDRRRSRMDPELNLLGTRPAYTAVDHIQVGLQGGDIPLAPQILVALRRHPPTLFSDIQTAPSYHSNIPHLDDDCGLLFSMHTGVMKRVRLRDMVAHLAALNLIVPNTSAYWGGCRDEMIAMLRSDQNSVEWYQGTTAEKRSALETLTNAALGRLKYSGVGRDKRLHIGWGSSHEIPVSKHGKDWILALANTQVTTTYAEVVPSCQETPECECRGKSTLTGGQVAKWEYPLLFRLQTTVSAYKAPRGSHASEEGVKSLQPGRSYFLNDPRLGIIAKVIGSTSTSSADGEKKVLYLSARKSTLKWLRRYFSNGIIRESRRGLEPVECVVGSGADFERFVTPLLFFFCRVVCTMHG